MMLRRYLERGLCIIKDQLSGMLTPLEGTEQIAALAESVSHDAAVAQSLSEQAASVLVAMSRDQAKFHVIAVKTPDEVTGQAGLLEDIALLTGARLFLNAIGDKLAAVRLEDLGYARRVWANTEYFGIVGPKGSPLARRQHLTKLEAAFDKADKPEDQQKLRQRIGTLRGGSATLHIGGIAETEIKTRKDNAERTVQVLRGALRKGVLPGGSVALLACQSVLRQRSKQAQDFDEKVAYNMLSRMLEEPLRTILSNAGHELEPILATLTRAASNSGFDARTGQVVDVVDSGIFDSAEVLIEAVTRAISSAALALTIDVFIHCCWVQTKGKSPPTF